MDLRESLNAIMEIVEKKCNEGDYIEISNKIKEVYNIKTTVEVEETVQYHVRTLEMINRENLELSESGVNIDILMKDVLTTTDRSDYSNAFELYLEIIHYDSLINNTQFLVENSYEEWRISIIKEFVTFLNNKDYPTTISQLLEAKDYCEKNNIEFTMNVDNEKELSRQIVRILFIKKLINPSCNLSNTINKIIRNAYEELCLDIELENLQ
tara:strand:- start:13 stop:645 length:633 start_codon:yes stop_codon:yes gene_type:complete